jgi:hypothetical protein
MRSYIAPTKKSKSKRNSKRIHQQFNRQNINSITIVYIQWIGTTNQQCHLPSSSPAAAINKILKLR